MRGSVPDVHRDVGVQMEIQTLVLQTGIGRGGGSASAAIHGGGRFGSYGDSRCEETVRAGCGPLTTKTLPDRLLSHLLYFSFDGSGIWGTGGRV
jgi:hypothetical protein